MSKREYHRTAAEKYAKSSYDNGTKIEKSSNSRKSSLENRESGIGSRESGLENRGSGIGGRKPKSNLCWIALNVDLAALSYSRFVNNTE